MVSLTKILLAVATWLEKHFPEKLTTSAVNKKFDSFSDQICSLRKDIDLLSGAIGKLIDETSKIKAIENELANLKSDINSIKTLTSIKSRVVNNSPGVPPNFPNLTPIMPSKPK